MTDPHQLRSELAAARSRASGKTFVEAPELFKNIEAVKAQIGAAEKKAGRDQKQYSEDR